MANGLLLQYVNKRKNDYKHFMGVSSLPSFELISKHISLSDANASGCGALATHRFDFQSQSHSIEVWEDLWKPQLSDLDIRVLKSYSYLGNDGENILDICKDIHVDFEQMRFIREKLERFGLLQSKNEEINDNNLKEIVKYLQNLEKESKKSKPGSVKIPKLKKVSGSDSYKITQLGRQYLTLIEA